MVLDQEDEDGASMDQNLTAESIKNLLDIIKEDNIEEKAYSNLTSFSLSKGKIKNLALTDDFNLEYIRVEISQGRQLSTEDPIQRDVLTIKPSEILEEVVESPEGENVDFTKIFFYRYDKKIPTENEYEKSDKLGVWFVVKSDQAVSLRQYLKGENVTGVEFPCAICGRELKLSLEKLQKIFGGNKNINQHQVDLFNNALKEGKFNSCNRLAHFFTQIKVESKNFQNFKELTGYTITGFLSTFLTNKNIGNFFNQKFWDENKHKDYFYRGVYLKLDSNKIATHKPKENGYYSIKRKENKAKIPISFVVDTTGLFKPKIYSDNDKLGTIKNLFSLVYANNVGTGNGAPSTYDGYNYRGRGIIQLTGRGTYRGVSDVANQLFKNDNFNWEVNYEAVGNRDKDRIYSAVAFFHWKLKGDLSILDTKDWFKVSKKVNGSYWDKKEEKRKVHKQKERRDNYYNLIQDFFKCNGVKK